MTRTPLGQPLRAGIYFLVLRPLALGSCRGGAAGMPAHTAAQSDPAPAAAPKPEADSNHVTLGAGASAAAAVMREDAAAAGQAMEKLWLSLEEAQTRLAARSADLQAERETTACLRRWVPVLLQSCVRTGRLTAGLQLCALLSTSCQAQHRTAAHDLAAVYNTWAVQRLHPNVQAPQCGSLRCTAACRCTGCRTSAGTAATLCSSSVRGLVLTRTRAHFALRGGVHGGSSHAEGGAA